jgi:type IV secretion system protein VirB10
VQQKAPKPLGLLPRHVQTWFVAGIAGLMVLIILFTGNTSSTPPGPVIPKLPSPIDPNQARIQEYRDRIDEQARRLAAEQAELAVAKRALAGVPGASPQGPPSEGSDDASAAPDPARAVEQEQRQREYRALFADNLALSLRPREGSVTSAAATRPTQAPTPPSLASTPTTSASTLPAPSLPTPPTLAANAPVPTPPLTPPTSTQPPAPTAAAPLDSDSAYTLREGTIIETVLTNRLDGSYAGPVNCLVTTPVYASDFQHVLIPRGSRVLGEARPVSQLDQRRLAVAFHRLLLPNGRAVSLDTFKGLNQIGETGLKDQVDRHYLEIFGASLAVGAIAGLAQVETRTGVNESWGETYRQGVSTSLAQSSLHILDRFLNRLPTLTIREGHRIKVYLSADLTLPAYRDDPAVPVIRH